MVNRRTHFHCYIILIHRRMKVSRLHWHLQPERTWGHYKIVQWLRHQ